MEILFVLMIMWSFGLIGVGITKMNTGTKRRSIVDWNVPKEIWEKDIEDIRYYANKNN